MYFDLNVDIVQPQNIEKERENSTSATNTELSGTSSASSVVNADDSPISGEVAGEFVTRQLFPVTITDDNIVGSFNGRERELEELRLGSSKTSNYNQWLNLTVSGLGSGSGSGSGLGSGVGPNPKQQVRKSRRGPRSRSSQYRGVTFYRRTGRWESHIWDCGKQVYLGGFDTAHAAARAYDRAAIKFRGVDADINFNITDYDEDMTQQVKNLSKEEFVQILRRENNGFSRGSSRYRGVATHKGGRWEAPTGQIPGNACDQAALQCNGRAALTNLEPSTYDRQIPMPVNNQGDGHNLDLNLGISITIDGPKARNYMGVGESQTYHSPMGPIQLANGKRPLNGVSPYYSTGTLPLYGQPMVSRQSSTIWPGLPQGQPETYEEKVSEQKAEPRPSNWAWYMERQGQGGGGGTTSNQVHFLSRAASSGFPFSTATTSTTFVTHPQPGHGHNDLHQYGEGRS